MELKHPTHIDFAAPKHPRHSRLSPPHLNQLFEENAEALMPRVQRRATSNAQFPRNATLLAQTLKAQPTLARPWRWDGDGFGRPPL